MPCTRVQLPGGQVAIVCTSGRQQPRCACGARAPLLCDWKIAGGTCDRPICRKCSTSPAPEKDLCPEHAVAWKSWLANRGRSKSGG